MNKKEIKKIDKEKSKGMTLLEYIISLPHNKRRIEEPTEIRNLVKIGENYTYLKDACQVKVLSYVGLTEKVKEYKEHKIYKVKALEDCDLLKIKKNDEFEATNGELIW